MIRNRATAIAVGLTLGVAFVAAACGPTTTGVEQLTPVPTPTPTPIAHLADPASIDTVFQALVRAGLQITQNDADVGSGALVTRLNLNYDSWPLIIEQYTSAQALRDASDFDPHRQLVAGDAPYNFAGLNILVAYGPHVSANRVATPSDRFAVSAARLVVALDAVIGPLQQDSLIPVPLPTPIPAPTAIPASPSSSGPGPT